MKTYEYIKEDDSRWWFFYDIHYKLWTVFEVDEFGNQISEECDFYHDKKQMVDSCGFNFKTVI